MKKGLKHQRKILVFALQMMAKVAANLEVSGSKIYNTTFFTNLQDIFLCIPGF